MQTLLPIGLAALLFIGVSLVLYFLILHQLKASQASTQTTVTTTQEETLRSMQGLESLQRDAQTLMHEIKTQQGTAQTFFADWQSSSQTLFQGWHKDTTELRRALQTPHQQGTWGEQELHRVVDLAGMLPHCDYDVQHRFPNGQKPDMIIYLHNNRSIIVDAKSHSQAYLDAVRCEDENARKALLKAYVRSVRDSIFALSGREYWKQIPSSPELVIIFMPNEAMLRVAFDSDPTLFDLASEKNVLLASPMTLIALLKAIAHGWSQDDRARNVQHIIEMSKTLQNELEMWFGEFHHLKKAIAKTYDAFDQVVNGYQTRVLPLITGLGQLDSTLIVKEAAFDLQPLGGVLLEARTDEAVSVQEEGKGISTPDTLTEPLKEEDVPSQ